MDHDNQSREFKPARSREELGLPDGYDKSLKDAADAVLQEYRDCSKWKRLKCRKVSVFAESERGVVYVVHVGSSVEFDWTWEGAVAFRPSSLDDQAIFHSFDIEDDSYSDQIVWSGEILEVDEQNGCLFISLANPEAMPTTGSFFVRPFEFLAVLNSVYQDAKFDIIRQQIPKRLNAARGGVHPFTQQKRTIGEPKLRDWWQHSWNVLWGPPGTGKTYTSGQQIAGVMQDKSERILVVSTTNRATDAIALSTGIAAKDKCENVLGDSQIVRVGKGASYQSFLENSLSEMLHGTESEMLSKIDGLAKQLRLFDSWEDKALTRKQIGELRASSHDQSKRQFVDPEIRVVVATAFKAMSFLNHDQIVKMLEEGGAPFTTIFIDEAGLISRAAVAALSMLASRRVVLVGDSKQLAPISRISRLLPTRQATWLASSGLSHLDEIDSTPTAVHVLSEQRRMHPEVCKVVSDYQYDGFLTTADETKQRESNLPSLIADYSRSIWYVLDEEAADLASIRARRGPGNKSWVRSVAPHVLKKLFGDNNIRTANGLFISPYKAQAQYVSKLLAKWGAKNWESSTVHSQQGSEADIVIFDTVNAGSYNWPPDEWKRLVNVALSRAREAIIVLASRSEMDEPYLRPLVGRLTEGVLVSSNNKLRWQKHGEQKSFRYKQGSSNQQVKESKAGSYQNEKRMGDQIADRKLLRPVLSHEQQRLSNLDLDGKPRLVRGVAGSGKSIVLSNWLAKTARKAKDKKDFRIWAVYANRSLHKLLQESIESAWRSSEDGQLFGQSNFPWDKVSLLHVKDVLAGILPSVELNVDSFNYDYDKAAEEFLNLQDANKILPRCHALFIDEAQDMGPSTLRLLLSLIQQTDEDDHNSRPAHIFFDNAQNIYGRGTPKWSEFGLDMRGRSTIMRESFRSTKPITEYAINVLDRLLSGEGSTEKKELLNLGLLEKCKRNNEEWLRVRFNQVNGPKPIFNVYSNIDDEMTAIRNHIIHLVAAENVSPTDICIIYNGKAVSQQLETMVGPKLAELDIELSVQTNRPFQRQSNTVVVTTSHSFKGYDAEVVFIPRADQYVTENDQILANNLYVAMTRARSLLAIYSQEASDRARKKINDALASCINSLNHTSNVELTVSRQDDFHDVLDLIGHQHRKWMLKIWNANKVSLEPIVDLDGKMISQPLFWFKNRGKVVACFEDDSGIDEDQMCRNGIVSLQIGGSVHHGESK